MFASLILLLVDFVNFIEVKVTTVTNLPKNWLLEVIVTEFSLETGVFA